MYVTKITLLHTFLFAGVVIKMYIHFYTYSFYKKWMRRAIYIFICLCCEKNVYTFFSATIKMYIHFCWPKIVVFWPKNSKKNVYTFLWLQQKCIYIFFCNHKNVYTFLLQRIKMYVALHTFLSKEQNLSPPFDKNVYWATYIFIEQIKMYIAQYTFLLRCFAL